MSSFGEILRKLRTEKNLSQDKLAEISGVHQANISRYEQGRDPGFLEACKLADALDVPLSAFRENDEIAGFNSVIVSLVAIDKNGNKVELATVQKTLPK